MAEKLVVVPATGDGFTAAVSALRSLDGKIGVSFHTYSLPEDCCVSLIIKILARECLRASCWDPWTSMARE
jgi:hypothetical protein